MNYHLTKTSANPKTGPIAVTTASRANCPPDCPLLQDRSCYAMNTRLAGHWGMVTDGTRGYPVEQLAAKIENLPAGSKLRYWQAGDNPGDGIKLDRKSCLMIAAAAQHLDRPFGYTHYRPTQFNLRILRAMARLGSTINLSADNTTEADQFVTTGLPVVVTVPEDTPAVTTTAAGNKIVICPEQTGKVDTCENCMLCATNRDYIIGFRAHGSKKQLVSNH